MQLVINPNTVARAYKELEEAGLVESNTRRGTIVKISPPPMAERERKKRLQPFLDQLITEARVLSFTDEELARLFDEALKRFGSENE